ncbi:SAM-dependent methyltransferase [Pleomorphomonas diazotrophica]|uniref:SAM-dependent methyltransferase n=1 Tax=Pleomorphomonas diazotrophica TaxID=1166257 RepID=A0A1I4RIX1_9HYPH|nr:methyltransferase domain-containing protein [Pleomorphomonas diazotrophica]PKR87556.1 SAM-dependent methyltransferase [Pleomorphomonas diazotrophica]SFM51903.1 Methyltransferase domain-containing protein [Pleomorphomonas diazotrophica]
MTPVIFDRSLLARRRARALAERKPGADFLLTLVADDLADRLAAVDRRFSRALVIGDPTGLLAARIAAGRVDEVVRADLLVSGLDGGGALVLDDEALPFVGGAFDLVVSSLALQFANDLPGALIEARRVLKPDGLFLGVLAGGDTLTELRQAFLQAESRRSGGASPRVAPMAEVRDLGGLLQRAGFALPVADQDRLTLRYSSALALMDDLKAMGASSVLADRRRGLTGPALMAEVAAIYQEMFGDPDGRVRASLSLVSLSGWAPHESQQKPLRPGSAKMRLADALKMPPRTEDD